VSDCKELKFLLAGDPKTCAVYVHIWRRNVGFSIWRKNRLQQTKQNDRWLAGYLSFDFVPEINLADQIVLDSLLTQAGHHAASALVHHNHPELALALNTHFGWQIANGALVPPLEPCRKTVGRVYSRCDQHQILVRLRAD
jgi:hypothetical protein